MALPDATGHYAWMFCLFDPSSSPSLQGASSNKFANDGSFLQQFMKMQKEKPNNVSGEYLDLSNFVQSWFVEEKLE